MADVVAAGTKSWGWHAAIRDVSHNQELAAVVGQGGACRCGWGSLGEKEATPAWQWPLPFFGHGWGRSLCLPAAVDDLVPMLSVVASNRRAPPLSSSSSPVGFN